MNKEYPRSLRVGERIRRDPLDLMNDAFIPAINNVGDLFGRGQLFLPELIKAAAAMEAVTELVGWVQAGKLHYEVDVQEGFENIPATLQRLFTGQNRGKQLLKIADPS